MFSITTLVIVIIVFNVTFAHSGRTDSSGGHRDNKNVSGLGSYHYHHGNPPHLHDNGVCPYKLQTVAPAVEYEEQESSIPKETERVVVPQASIQTPIDNFEESSGMSVKSDDEGGATAGLISIGLIIGGIWIYNVKKNKNK